jgi:hypothetical protein
MDDDEFDHLPSEIAENLKHLEERVQRLEHYLGLSKERLIKAAPSPTLLP